MTAPAFAVAAPATAPDDFPVHPTPQPGPAPEPAPADPQPKASGRKGAGKKAKTFELTLAVTGTADGEWRGEIKQGSTYLVRNLAISAAAVSRAAKELHEEIFGPIESLMNEARSQQAARVAALEAELEAARKALADLD
ncbi:DUF6319 family protein [[Mycobacterium] kokjensenii]|uniref:DUF6319 family protein n=1 Tax=[Mycobacterium] kokjensenii TaxID=3064287 RepID=A0ABN9MZH7_9MYCO|nr:DUF6319 family protein [Mycolicibacter sp. MU0083]CAJ1497828.1 DUF6319 family protein [Mycolicibacter sp. MU0083]